ncbi:MAG: glycosyltransferase family 2 protein [Muribaculaceae bacterium]|nr:glycosyltransferase family 2 protein [Muribaculaceae bacterium]
MQIPLISVIVPVFNVERYLAACLDSILSQSYKNLEVIVINDGSTDFSMQIAETYAEKDDRVTVYNHKNEGLSEARNRGLEVATGDFITFVDADDMLLPRALEAMMQVALKHSVDIVQGTMIRDKILPVDIHQNKKFPIKIFFPEEAIKNVLYQDKFLPAACGKLYKKEIFSEIRFEKGILYEDLNIFYHLFESSDKIAWIDFPVYFYRDAEGSLINTWNLHRLDVLKVTENIEEHIQNKYPSLLPAAQDRRLSANFNMFALCSINGDRENASKCWKQIKQYRKASFFNPNVRLKNKAGIILSYLGKNLFLLVSRRIYSK